MGGGLPCFVAFARRPPFTDSALRYRDHAAECRSRSGAAMRRPCVSCNADDQRRLCLHAGYRSPYFGRSFASVPAASLRRKIPWGIRRCRRRLAPGVRRRSRTRSGPGATHRSSTRSLGGRPAVRVRQPLESCSRKTVDTGSERIMLDTPQDGQSRFDPVLVCCIIGDEPSERVPKWLARFSGYRLYGVRSGQ